MRAGFPGAGLCARPHWAGLPWLPHHEEAQSPHSKAAPLFHSVSEEVLREELELATLGALKTCLLTLPALDPQPPPLMVFGEKFLLILSNLLKVFAFLRMADAVGNHTGLGSDAVLSDKLGLSGGVAS